MSDITIRPARPADDARLRRLAALDSRRPPTGEVLIAEVCGDLVAAHSAAGTVADPFRPTSDVVDLLRVRAASTAPEPRRSSRRPLSPRLRAA